MRRVVGGYKRRRFSADAGYTLIELIVVAVILGILAGMIYPSAQKMLANRRLDLAARQLASEIREMQQWAITMNNTYSINFYFSGHYYHVPQKDNNLNPHQVDLPEGIRFVEITYVGTSDGKLEIDAKGAPNFGGHITITNGQKQRQIVIAAITGRVRIE